MASSSTSITGGGTFTLSSGATLGITSTAGITSSGATGNVQVTGTRSFSTGANYTYNGSAAQATGNGLPSTVNNLTINNSSGVTLSASTTVNGTLTLSSGNVITGANTLSISSTGSVTRTSGHVVGNLQKNVATGATSRTFEIGDSSNYTPINVSFGNVTSAGDLTASTTAGDHPSITNSGIIAAKSVNRYWTMTNSGISFDTYSATFNFAAGDIDSGASTNNFFVSKLDGGTWTLPAIATRSATSIQATGMTSFSDFQVGETPSSPPPPEPPPRVILTINSTSPTNGAASVAVNTSVSATFSLLMNGSTLTTSTFKLSGGGRDVSGVVTTIGATATFTPSSNLAHNTTYTATITTGASAANFAGTTL
ncbi:MAG: Ig-like domain-containing protein, partial [Planctomycetes bacterium]|nr:Ig-like domain-containing protein [Planctomycetota bacterium]